MARKRAPVTKETLPPGAEDLKLITGIGPAVEHRLHGVGLFTFAQLAAMSPADIAALVGDISGLTAERISKQDWIGQARMLAASRKAGEPEPPPEHPPSPPAVGALPQAARQRRSGDIQRTATFTIELVLNEAGEALSTELVHVQSRQKERWEGWQEARLLRFLAQQAKLALPATTSSETTGETAEPSSTSMPLPPLAEEEPPPSPPVATPANHSVLLGVETLLSGLERAQPVLFGDQPFDVRFILDLSALPLEGHPSYIATISAHRLGEPGERSHLPLAEARGTLMAEDAPVVHVEGITLSPGTYRLEASFRMLATNGEADIPPILTATKRGSLLHITQES